VVCLYTLFFVSYSFNILSLYSILVVLMIICCGEVLFYFQDFCFFFLRFSICLFNSSFIFCVVFFISYVSFFIVSFVSLWYLLKSSLSLFSCFCVFSCSLFVVPKIS
jgi:hypothetical protein